MSCNTKWLSLVSIIVDDLEFIRWDFDQRDVGCG